MPEMEKTRRKYVMKKPRPNKRKDILDASMRVFRYYGYDAATFDMISREAGVSPSLVVKFFGKKENIVVQCLNDFFDEFIRKADRSVKAPGITFEQHCDNMFELFKINRPEWRFVFSFLMTPAHGEISRRVVPAQLHLATELVEHFSDRIAPEQILPMTYIMTSMYIGYALGGSEENYLRSRSELFARLLTPPKET